MKAMNYLVNAQNHEYVASTGQGDIATQLK